MTAPLPRVFVTVHIPLEHLSPLEGIAEFIMPDNGVKAAPRAQVLEAIGDCVAVLSQGELRVDAEFLDAAKSLRFVANAASPQATRPPPSPNRPPITPSA